MTNIFQNFFKIDTLEHTISGSILAFIGLKLIIKLNNNEPLLLRIKIAFMICFTMFIAVFWEFIEFNSDFFLLTNNQKDRIVNKFSTNKINKLKSHKIENIDHTVIYDKNDKVIARTDGYIDIGIIDTIKDMSVCMFGSLAYTSIYIVNEKKKLNNAVPSDI